MTESGDPVPNITPHPDGLADWTRADLTGFMEFGMDVDGDYTGGDMADVIDHNLSKLSNADRVAIAEYLMSIEPLPDSP